jgi:hypothetical protein
MTYKIRLCEISSMPWRRAPTTVPQKDFTNTDKFDSFYAQFQGQVPDLLAQTIFDVDSVFIRSAVGPNEQCAPFARVEVVLFSLPFPANQIVAAVILDFSVPDIAIDGDPFLASLLKAAAESRLLIEGRPTNEIADELAQSVLADEERAANPGERIIDGGRERHALVFSEGNNLPADPTAQQVISELVYGVRRPYREEFTNLVRPEDLNRVDSTFAAVSDHTSFFHGQSSVVESSILLTTVQAIGTAARFQRIWHDAYYQVTEFQRSKQQAISGRQTRKDLETLADQMGNLELDLAFSVETAADLGLGSTNAQIDSFHRALYDVMQIKARAATVGRMFTRLSGSIRSELTAIESREKEVEDHQREIVDARRFRGALMLGVLSFFLAPLGVVLGFFGVNAREVDQADTMFDVHRYWAIYVLAAVVMIVSVIFALTFDPTRLRREARRRLWGRRTKPSEDPEAPAQP